MLVDEVVLILYICCKYGRKDMECMKKAIIRCHICGKEISGERDFRQCDCGYQYSYKEYRRSFRRNNMPTGAASKVFEEYMVKWEVAKEYSEKMILLICCYINFICRCYQEQLINLCYEFYRWDRGSR